MGEERARRREGEGERRRRKCGEGRGEDPGRITHTRGSRRTESSRMRSVRKAKKGYSGKECERRRRQKLQASTLLQRFTRASERTEGAVACMTSAARVSWASVARVCVAGVHNRVGTCRETSRV